MNNKKIMLKFLVCITLLVIVVLGIIYLVTRQTDSEQEELIEEKFDVYENAVRGNQQALTSLGMSSHDYDNAVSEIAVVIGGTDAEKLVRTALGNFEITVDEVMKSESGDDVYTVNYTINQYDIQSEATIKNSIEELSEEEKAIYYAGRADDNPRYEEVYSKIFDIRAERILGVDPKEASFTVEVKIVEDNVELLTSSAFKQFISQMFNYELN